MSTIFVGGSRKISRLPPMAKQRLDNVMAGRHRVVVGDAAGADKAVQGYLAKAGYRDVVVFHSGTSFRHNIGMWPTHSVQAAASSGFQFYAAKDRALALAADYGLMIWDGESPGTALNVLRLLNAGKKVVMLDADGSTATFKTMADWDGFIAGRDAAFRRSLRERATETEWSSASAQAVTQEE